MGYYPEQVNIVGNMITDPICNLISLLKLHIQTNKEKLFVPYGKATELVCKLLFQRGYIRSYSCVTLKTKGQYDVYICIFLNIISSSSSIHSIELISTPSRKVVYTLSELKKYYRYMGSDSDLVVRTHSGYRYGSDCLKCNLGGEILFRIN